MLSQIRAQRLNETVVYASGTNRPASELFPPGMMKTVDGGQNWTGWEMSDYATILINTYFTSPDRGWVIGGKADRNILDSDRKNIIPVRLGGDFRSASSVELPNVE